jgi:hypothetical protein
VLEKCEIPSTKSLTNVLRITVPMAACVQSISDTHKGFAVDEDDELVAQLCTILEVALSHKLKSTYARGATYLFRQESSSGVSFWGVFYWFFLTFSRIFLHIDWADALPSPFRGVISGFSSSLSNGFQYWLSQRQLAPQATGIQTIASCTHHLNSKCSPCCL